MGLWLRGPLLISWCLIFNTRSRFVLAFPSKIKCFLIWWLQSPFTVIFGPKKIKSVTDSTLSPSIWQVVMGPDALVLVFWLLSSQQGFSLSSFIFIKTLFSSSSLSLFTVLPAAHLRLLKFLPETFGPAYYTQWGILNSILCIYFI